MLWRASKQFQLCCGDHQRNQFQLSCGDCHIGSFSYAVNFSYAVEIIKKTISVMLWILSKQQLQLRCYDQRQSPIMTEMADT